MSKTITLGGQQFALVAMALGKMREIGVASSKGQLALAGPDAEAEFYTSAFAILAAGTGKTVQEIEAIENSTFDEVITARRAVMVAAGLRLKEPEGDGQGEAAGATG